jgi:(4S)-4-hydroxy-5-phosphonooxypentane-2,3-dione isomerase
MAQSLSRSIRVRGQGRRYRPINLSLSREIVAAVSVLALEKRRHILPNGSAFGRFRRERRIGRCKVPRLAIVATIEIAPGRREELLPLLMAHRARCLKDEPDTAQFDVLLPQEGDAKVVIYEIYRDEAALGAHMNGPSLARLRKEAAGMMASVSGIRCTVAE